MAALRSARRAISSVNALAPRAHSTVLTASRAAAQPHRYAGDSAALRAVSPIDGRYADSTQALAPFFSEAALIRYRVAVEIAWVRGMFPLVASKDGRRATLSADAAVFLQHVLSSFGFPNGVRNASSKWTETALSGAEAVKQIEATTRHDVKAVEYHVKALLRDSKLPELVAAQEFVHFACTSEDITNLSYACAISDARSQLVLPEMRRVVDTLVRVAEEAADVPMLARTHGQPATPTTMGKELATFAYRLARQVAEVARVRVHGKFGGAVANYNAHMVAFPSEDWERIGREFVEGLGLTYNPFCTQIEPHDWLAELCHAMSRYNTVLLDLDRDMWGYVSLGYFRQKAVAGEVGSSTMPHKINPIDFENSEGNIGLANALMGHMAEKLPVSRFQRDLSDSTVLRNVGSAFAYSMIAYKSTQKGLSRVSVDRDALQRDLDQHAEVLGEAIQTVMRRYGAEAPYEKLKELTRGRSGVTSETMRDFIAAQVRVGAIPKEAAQELTALRPSTYVGNAAAKARSLREEIEKLSRA